MPYADPALQRAAEKRYYLRNKEVCKARAYAAGKSEKHKAWQKEWARRRYEDPKTGAYLTAIAKTNQILRGDINGRFGSKYIGLLGCSPEQFREHLERQFLPGMTWQNRGRRRGEWQVDHIRPGTAFDLTDEAQFAQFFHYTNTRPLWGHDNISRRHRNA